MLLKGQIHEVHMPIENMMQSRLNHGIGKTLTSEVTGPIMDKEKDTRSDLVPKTCDKLGDCRPIVLLDTGIVWQTTAVISRSKC